MSIYTDMQEIIEERGLITQEPFDPETGCVCLFGAKAIADGIKPTEQAMWDYDEMYDATNIPELVELVLQVPGIKHTGADAVWYYNDIIIDANKDEAIEMLSRAEMLRRERESA